MTDAARGTAPLATGSLYAQLRETLHGRSPQHRPYQTKSSVALDCERIAFYLPQFHRCEENDRFWGSGFTEWSNVVRALPKFAGHYQPRIPGDLGFYDLLIEDNIRRQVEIARNYGMTGFMFYFYWFGGKAVLETPIRSFLRRKDLRFRFFLMWANENWTRRWDGLDDEILLGQTYAEDEPERFVRHLCDYLEDDRYVRIDGRPIIAVYRPSKIPNIRSVAERWREACVGHGFKNPYLVSALCLDEGDPRAIGFDAAVEFPPHHMHLGRDRLPVDIKSGLQAFAEPVKDVVWPYAGVVESQLSVHRRPYRVFRTAFPSWDNTPRRKDGKAWVTAYSTPELFAKWVHALLQAEMNSGEEFKMVCFNAWNEWAEGAYLEPDSYFGYAYLDALHRVLADAAGRSPAPR